MLRPLHQTFFSLNLGFAIALTATILVLRKPLGFVHGVAQAPDLFQRLWIHINLTFNHVAADYFGIVVALIALTLIVSGLLLLLLRLLDKTRRSELILTALGGIAATAAVPVSWFLVPAQGWYTVLLEFAILGGILYLSRTRPNPIWFLALTVHYSVWAWLVWILAYEKRLVRALSAGEWPWPILLSVVAPCAGYIWALYVIRVSRIGTR